MQSSTSPFDILVDELGSVAGRIERDAGRIERELRQWFEAALARIDARVANIELAALRAENERDLRLVARLAELKDGRDGEPGRDGKDADIEPLEEMVSQRLASLGLAFADLESKAVARIAEVKDGEPGRDGKDGEQGPHGKDADIEPFAQRFVELEDKLEAKVSERLSIIKDGKDGEPGPAGKDGKLAVARQWTNRVHYEGDIVRHNGSTYQALADTGSEPPSGDWGELASRGKDGRGFTLRGTYDATQEYHQHDVVIFDKGSFAAKHDNPGKCPGDGWKLFAGAGGRGKEGPPGPRGLKGDPVAAPRLIKGEVDPEALTLKLAFANGESLEVDLTPIAERILEEAR